MRRKDRELNLQQAESILNEGLYGTLATAGNNIPYAIPLFYVYLDGAIYFHCAEEGHKLDNIKENNRVCFNVVSKVEVIPEEFAAFYSSATVFGIAEEALGEEKKKALVFLIEKYSAEFYNEGMEYIDKLIEVTYVCKISPEVITGKGRLKE